MEKAQSSQKKPVALRFLRNLGDIFGKLIMCFIGYRDAPYSYSLFARPVPGAVFYFMAV
jgi:hypothetical protein